MIRSSTPRPPSELANNNNQIIARAPTSKNNNQITLPEQLSTWLLLSVMSLAQRYFPFVFFLNTMQSPSRVLLNVIASLLLKLANDNLIKLFDLANPTA